MKKSKLIFCAVFSFVMLLMISFSVSASEVGTYFDATKNSLQISGSVGTLNGTPVTVHISKYTSNTANFSMQNTPLASHLLFTGENGALSETLPLSSQFKNNKYSVHVYATEDDGSEFYRNIAFVCFNPDSTEAKEAVKRINDAASIDITSYKTAINQNAMSLGIDLTEYTEHYDYASEISYALKTKMTDGKFTPLSFRDTFFASVAASIIKNNNDVAGAIATYFSQFGTTQDKYLALDSNKKNVLNELLNGADYKSDILSVIYNEKLSVTELVTESDREKFKETVLENEVFGISTDDSTYKKIPASYRNLVFTDMFSERSTYTSAQDVLDSFDKNTAAILKKYSDGDNSGSPSGSSSSRPSSSVSTSTGTNILIPSPVPEKVPSTDIQGGFADTNNHWAKDSIDFLVNLGAINGFPDNTYKPDKSVTRAEFAKIVCLTFGISGSYTGEFTDVAKSDWFAQSVSALSQNKIVTGYNSLFSPNANIKREDAAVILCRLCAHLGISLSDGKNDFSDRNAISEYANNAVNTMAASDIIKGNNNGMFNPQGSLTRAEAAALIQRVYNLSQGGMSK